MGFIPLRSSPPPPNEEAHNSAQLPRAKPLSPNSLIANSTTKRTSLRAYQAFARSRLPPFPHRPQSAEQVEKARRGNEVKHEGLLRAVLGEKEWEYSVDPETGDERLEYRGRV